MLWFEVWFRNPLSVEKQLLQLTHCTLVYLFPQANINRATLTMNVITKDNYLHKNSGLYVEKNVCYINVSVSGGVEGPESEVSLRLF